jgi:hypothetical protein
MRALLAVILLSASLAAQGPAGRGQQPATISGRLLTHDGSPAASVRVAVMEVGNPLFPDSQALVSISQTDRSGRFRLEQVPPGRYFITAGALDVPTYFPGVDTAVAAHIVNVPGGANLAGVDFNLSISSGLRFSGKVIRQDNTGRPITGPVAPPNPSAQPMQIRLQGPNVLGNQVMTLVDRDGSFDFRQIPPGTYQVQVVPTQARMPQMSVTLLDRDITDYLMSVPLMAQVTGVVTIEDGGPTPRFPIVFSNASENSGSSVQQSITAQAAPRFGVQVPVGANRVTPGSIPNGFTIRKMMADGVDLTLNPLNVTPSGAPLVQIVLSASVSWVRVSGRVTGRSVLSSGNVITVSPSQASSAPLQLVLYLDGTFEIPKALPGAYRVIGGGAATSELSVPSGLSEVRGVVIDLVAAETSGAAMPVGGPSSAARVSGRIVGRAKAQPGAHVRIENAETGELRRAPIFVDGSFEFPQTLPGNYVAEVVPQVPGAAPTSFTVGLRDVNDLQLLVPSSRDIAGKVTLEGAGELPRSLTFVAASSRIPADVRADGSFTVTLPDTFPVALASDTLPEGYAVSAVRYGIWDLLASPLQLSGPETELRVTLKTTRGASSVSGRVSGDAGVLGGARVWLVDTSGRQRTIETTLGPNGGFAFPVVREGSYSLNLVVAGISANAVSSAVQVTAGRDVADVSLAAPRAVSGRVRVDGGVLPERFSIRLDGTTIVIDPRPDGSFSVLVPTGDRAVGAAAGLPPELQIQAMTYGSTDLLKNPLRVATSGALEELNIRLGSAPR